MVYKNNFNLTSLDAKGGIEGVLVVLPGYPSTCECLNDNESLLPLDSLQQLLCHKHPEIFEIAIILDYVLHYRIKLGSLLASIRIAAALSAI